LKGIFIKCNTKDVLIITQFSEIKIIYGLCENGRTIKCFVKDMIVNAIDGMTYVCFWYHTFESYLIFVPQILFVFTPLIYGIQCKYFGFVICRGFLKLKIKFLI